MDLIKVNANKYQVPARFWDPAEYRVGTVLKWSNGRYQMVRSKDAIKRIFAEVQAQDSRENKLIREWVSTECGGI